MLEIDFREVKSYLESFGNIRYSDPSLNGTVRFPALNGTEKEKIIKGVSSGHIDLFYTPLEAP